MKTLKKNLKRLLQDESGQGAMEYILILVVVGGLVMVFKDEILKIVKARTEGMGTKLGQTMEGLSSP